MPPKRSLILRSAWSLNNEPVKSGSPVLISGFPIFLSVPHSLDNFVTVQSQADLSKKGVEQLHNFLNFPEPSDFLHMARPNGRFCGAKRPKCEAEQPLGFD